jgi:hypothetical protein
MTAMEDFSLLGEIAGFAGEMTAKPRALPPGDWAEQVEFLDQRLAAAVASTGYRHIVGNFAPLLIQAMRRGLAARRACDDRNTERFGALIGFLIEYVRSDAQALLARAKEA